MPTMPSSGFSRPRIRAIAPDDPPTPALRTIAYYRGTAARVSTQTYTLRPSLHKTEDRNVYAATIRHKDSQCLESPHPDPSLDEIALLASRWGGVGDHPELSPNHPRHRSLKFTSTIYSIHDNSNYNNPILYSLLSIFIQAIPYVQQRKQLSEPFTSFPEQQQSQLPTEELELSVNNTLCKFFSASNLYRAPGTSTRQGCALDSDQTPFSVTTLLSGTRRNRRPTSPRKLHNPLSISSYSHFMNEVAAHFQEEMRFSLETHESRRRNLGFHRCFPSLSQPPIHKISSASVI
jgi:hypothetical protein